MYKFKLVQTGLDRFSYITLSLNLELNFLELDQSSSSNLGSELNFGSTRISGKTTYALDKWPIFDGSEPCFLNGRTQQTFTTNN